MEFLESRCLLAGDLRITEVNFNPHPSMTQFGERDADSDDYEFIEVANVGDAPMQLNDYEFTAGIDVIPAPGAEARLKAVVRSQTELILFPVIGFASFL